jgi:hypothetical protein
LIIGLVFGLRRYLILKIHLEGITGHASPYNLFLIAWHVTVGSFWFPPPNNVYISRRMHAVLLKHALISCIPVPTYNTHPAVPKDDFLITAGNH